MGYITQLKQQMPYIQTHQHYGNVLHHLSRFASLAVWNKQCRNCMQF